MGLLDDFFDVKVVDDSSRLKFTPMKFGTKKTISKHKEMPERESKIKECAKWVYINTVAWCIAMKGTHIHKMCMLEIFDNLDSRKGIACNEFIDTLVPEWGDYWYDSSNHKNYNKQQLKRVEKEFDKGRESEDLVYEMLCYVWFNMINESQLYEEIDDVLIYKLRIKYMK